MNVLSLFDGMSCGKIALDRAKILVKNYYASEIDKYAIQISKKNYPDIIHLGDINLWDSWDIQKPDIIMGGSPCQGFSFAGKQLAFNDPRSKLFFKFLEVVEHYKPKYFLLENVKMKKEYLDYISLMLNVEPICINSALVSAQNRVRYYWTNLPNVTQPENKQIVLSDILEEQGIVGRMTGRRINKEGKRQDYNYSIPAKQRFEPRKDNKSGCLTTVQKDNLVFKELALDINTHECRKRVYGKEGKCPTLVTPSGGYSEPKIDIGENMYRKLTPLECERLQTVNDGYTEGVSNTQRYKMLGNGWTVDVIAHILKCGLIEDL